MPPPPPTLRWEVPSEFRWLGVVDASLQELGNEQGWSREDLNAVSIAVIEAMSNAIEHGNHEDPALTVRLALSIDGNDLTATVEDEGPGFDPGLLSPPPPTTDTAELLKIRGRGLQIMKTLTDSLEFSREGERFAAVLQRRMTVEIPETD